MNKTHIVLSGESLSIIANKYEITLIELLTENPKFTQNGRSPNLIYPGESVNIPSTKKFSKAVNLKKGKVACEKAEGRKDLNEILNEYQVLDDTVIDWSPKALGTVPVPFAGEYRLTETEGNILDQLSINKGLLGLSDFNDIKDQAFENSEQLYPDPQQGDIPDHIPTDRQGEWIGNDGHRDAFRHAYWNALLAKKFGGQWAEQFTTAHEALPGNPGTREAMDLYNNKIGREVYANNPGASDEELANLIQEAVNDGKLVIIDKDGNLAWSDCVPLHEHGLTDGISQNGVIPVPNIDVSGR